MVKLVSLPARYTRNPKTAKKNSHEQFFSRKVFLTRVNFFPSFLPSWEISLVYLFLFERRQSCTSPILMILSLNLFYSSNPRPLVLCRKSSLKCFWVRKRTNPLNVITHIGSLSLDLGNFGQAAISSDQQLNPLGCQGPNKKLFSTEEC